MINTVAEWLEIAAFAALALIACVVIGMVSLAMALWMLCLAIYETDLKRIIE